MNNSDQWGLSETKNEKQIKLFRDEMPNNLYFLLNEIERSAAKYL